MLCKLVIFMIRKKDNVVGDKVLHRSYYKITGDPDVDALNRFLKIEEMKNYSNLYPGQKFRVYESVNARDMDKATLELQRTLLGYSGNKGVDRLWLSILQKPLCRAERKFLIDVDHEDDKEYEAVYDTLIYNNVSVLDVYSTKNGHHIITKPFSPALLSDYSSYAEVKKDSLRLVFYSE